MLLEYYYPNYKLDFVSFWLVKISKSSISLRDQQPLVAPKGKHPPPLLAIFLKLWPLKQATKWILQCSPLKNAKRHFVWRGRFYLSSTTLV